MRKETIEVLVIEKDDKPSDYVVEAWGYPIVIQESTNAGPKLYSCRGLPHNGEKVKLGDGIKNLDAKFAASANGIIDGLSKSLIGVSIVGDYVRVTGESASFNLSLREALAVTQAMNHRNDPHQEPREIDSLSSLIEV
jgi:hypothetical protein